MLDFSPKGGGGMVSGGLRSCVAVTSVTTVDPRALGWCPPGVRSPTDWMSLP